MFPIILKIALILTIHSTYHVRGVRADDFSRINQDSDVGRNVSQLIRSRGFGVEEYDVTTKDGYIINIQRIINPKIEPTHLNLLKPALLMHGLFGDSSTWVVNSPYVKPHPFPPSKLKAKMINATNIDYDIEDLNHPNSLGYYLANTGHDVFLGNVRGTLYGRRHLRKSQSNTSFWDFSYDEIAQYDLPAIIAQIMNITKQSKMSYVGYSQGTLLMFALMSDRPEYADIIEPFIALAPIAFLRQVSAPFKPLAMANALVTTFMNAPFEPVPINDIAPGFCDLKVNKKLICNTIYHALFSYDKFNFDDNRWSAYLSSLPSGTSLRNINHYGQGMISGRFARYDYTPIVNKFKYNKPNPPEYDLSRIRSRSIFMFVAKKDNLADPEDVAHLIQSLKVKPSKVVNVTETSPTWNHMDFAFSRNAGKVLNGQVDQILRQFRHY